MVDLSIIVLSFNTSEKTLNCLKSVISYYSKELEEKSFELIVVDNNSSDDSVKVLKEFKKTQKKVSVTLVENKVNKGFGGGNNAGAKVAKGEFVLFLNSDTEIFGKGFNEMIAFLRQKASVGVLGGKLYNTNGTAQKSVGSFYTLPKLALTLFGGGRMGLLSESPAKIKKVDWVSGALCMVRRYVFEKIGGYDENIFMYVEDMELCYRFRETGYEVCYFPDTKVKHIEQGSSNRTFAIVSIYKGTLYFFKKHKGKMQYNIARSLLILKAKLAILIGMMTANSYLVKTYKEAIQF